MAVTFELFWLFALCAILSFAHGGLLPNNRLHARASSDDSFVTTYLSTINDGILVKDGQQTFCSVIPINSKYAFVAASCFETKGNKENNNMNYEVYLSGPGYKTPTLIDVTSIQLHKDYDENTFANNIGILTIDNSNSTSEYFIGGPPSEWATLSYIEHSLTEDLTAWNTPIQNAGTSVSTSQCAGASSLYKANEASLLCNSVDRKSYYNTSCETPLKFVVGSSGGMEAVVSLYSYSAIAGTPADGFCNSKNTILSYYTNLCDYVQWAEDLLSITIGVRHANIGVTSVPSSVVMTNPSSSATNDGSYIYSLYESDTAKLGSDNGSTPTKSSNSPTKSSNSPRKSSHDDNSGDDGNDSCNGGDTLTVTVTHTLNSCKCD